MRSIYLNIAVLSITFGSAFAGSNGDCVSQELAHALSTDSAEIRTLLANTLKPHIHTLNRQVYFYSWTWRNPGVSAEQAFTQQAGNGRGLFAAPDPLAGVDFGGDGGDGALLRIGVPAGTRFLDAGAQIEVPGRYNVKIARGIFPLSPEDTLKVKEYSNHAPTDKTVPALISEIYKNLQIGFTIDPWRRSSFLEGANLATARSEVIFPDPSLSSQLKLDLLPEKPQNVSPEQEKAYQEVLEYFDIFDLEHDDTSNSRKDGFWRFYRAWAPGIYELPPDTDLVAYQKQRFLELQSKRKKLIATLFGRSGARKYLSEAPAASIDPQISAIIRALGNYGFDSAATHLQINKKSYPVLIAALEDESPLFRTNACSILGAMKVRRAIPALTKALQDPDADVRIQAERALSQMNRY